MFERIAMAVIISLTAASFFAMYLAWQDCNERGGVLVRGMLAMECVNASRL